MDLTRKIDGYCERTTPEFWAEPLNAVSNGFFILAAVATLVMAMRRGRLDGPVGWLVALLFIIGLGSFLFHTFATAWAAIADTFPIMLFILSYFTISMRCYGGYSWGRSFLLLIGFIAALVALSYVLNILLRDLIGGSVSYVPAMLALLAVGLWLSARAHPAGIWLICVSGLFAVSLTARALDLPLCETLPAGTHWAWHLLNSIVLGTLIVALIRHGRRTESA